MKLTTEQQEKSIALRALFNSNPPIEEEAWGAYIDFTRAMARMLDGVDTFINPTAMKEAFDVAWKSFVKIWTSENKRLILEAIGGDEVLFDQIRGHPKGRMVLGLILDRVKEEKGGISYGLDATDVDATDILLEEMPDIVEG